MNQIEIDGRLVGDGCPALIVAEIGNNHDGNLGQAKNLIDAAAAANADAVKFQTHCAEEEMLPDSPIPGHFSEPRYEFTKRMELTEDHHRQLKQHAESRGLLFLSTPVSTAAADLLDRVGVSCFKIGSGDVSDLPLLECVAAKGKPIILSTGMSSWSEVEQAQQLIQRHNVPLILMQCTSSYPCPYDDVGITLIPEIRKRFNVPVGLSDHTSTIYTAIASAVLGCCVIEKHFTLSKMLYGPDHKFSLLPDELARLVEGTRAVERALRNIDKDDTSKFADVRNVFQKSIVSAVDIDNNAVITRGMVTTKRPGTGLSPAKIEDIIGKKTRRHIPANTMLCSEWLD